jgi:hypothetical protein
MIEQVETDPAIPIHWGKNKPGMQAHEENRDELGNLVYVQTEAVEGVDKDGPDVWLDASRHMVTVAASMDRAGYHKQIVNRLLEPFQFINVVVTATEYENWYHLRDHKNSQPEICELAQMMRQAHDESEPEVLQHGQWHLPYITEDEWQAWADGELKEDVMIKASAARCARVSYLNHDKSSPEMDKDLELFDMLATRPYEGRGMTLDKDEPTHESPLEHQATPMEVPCYSEDDPVLLYREKGVTHIDMKGNAWSGNFKGWIQYRQLM